MSTCTFANLKLDTIVIVKRAVGGDGGFALRAVRWGTSALATVEW